MTPSRCPVQIPSVWNPRPNYRRQLGTVNYPNDETPSVERAPSRSMAQFMQFAKGASCVSWVFFFFLCVWKGVFFLVLVLVCFHRLFRFLFFVFVYFYLGSCVSISLFHFLKDHLCMCVFLSSLNSVMTRSLRFCVRSLENYFLHAWCLNSTSKISHCSMPAPPPPPPSPQEGTPWLPWGP